MKSLMIPMAAAISIATLVVVTATPVEAKQCVWNKAGFVLKVEWYQPESVIYNTTNNDVALRPDAEVVQTDVFPLGQGRCQERDEVLVAVLRADKAEWVKKGLQIGIGVGAGILGAVACVGTEGAACPGVAAGVSGLVTASGEFIPEAKQLETLPGAFAVTCRRLINGSMSGGRFGIPRPAAVASSETVFPVGWGKAKRAHASLFV
jgi:hypothetical protein